MNRKLVPVRWRILAVLTGLSVTSYLLRTNISVASKFMMPELELNQIQMGQIFGSFMLGYALFQIPSGVLGDRLGPRKVLTVAASLWGIVTVLTGLVPGGFVESTLGTFLSLLFLRFLLGIGEAATYPVAARAIANWFPTAQLSLANGIVLTGVPLGSALAPPLVSWLMVTLGWRQSFLVTAILAFVVACLWWWYGRDQPNDHPGISEQEARLIAAKRGAANSSWTSTSWFSLLRNRSIVLLSVSYVAEGYVLFMFVFWFYLYLVEVRGFSVLGGGMFASLPWVVSLFLTPAGGAMADYFARRIGQLRGCRIVVMGGWIACGIFIVLGATAANPYLAVAGLSLSVGFILFTEAAFWSSAIHVSGPHAGAACGIMNMAGLFGGVISTPLVPVLVQHFGWSFALSAAAAVAVAGALIWLLVSDDAPLPYPALSIKVP